MRNLMPPVVAPAPGMPRTGAPTSGPLLLLLGLLSLGAGVRLRRLACGVRVEA